MLLDISPETWSRAAEQIHQHWLSFRGQEAPRQYQSGGLPTARMGRGELEGEDPAPDIQHTGEGGPAQEAQRQAYRR